jgi:hypothetical protein
MVAGVEFKQKLQLAASRTSRYKNQLAPRYSTSPTLMEHNTQTQLIYYVEYVSLNILQNVLVIGVLNVKKGYVPNVKNIIACLKALEHMTLFQLKIIRNYQIIFQKLFITAKTMI